MTKKYLKPIAKFLQTFGFDPRKTASLLYYPKFKKQLNEFKRLGGVVTNRYMILQDFADQAGTAGGHYFHQDLLVASFINQKNPIRHIDVGSRIDGFVAHVASFRKIEIIDVRSLKDTGHENIIFMKANLMAEQNCPTEITDSLSCLHVIEHFGLGRYGDPLDPNGHIKGFNNLLRMLKINGTLFISFPIGHQNEVHFNAHRVFHYKDIFKWANVIDSVKLERFDYVDDTGNLHKNIDINNVEISVEYGCGIYTFKKLH